MKATLINTDVCRQLEGAVKHLQALTDANPAELELSVKNAVKYLNKYIAERKELTREIDAYKKELMIPEKAAVYIIKAAKERIAELTKQRITELLAQLTELGSGNLKYYSVLSELELIAEPVAAITVHDISQVPLEYLTVDMAKVKAAVADGKEITGITVTTEWQPK